MSRNEIQVFTSKTFGKIRMIMIDGEPWFVAKDVAVALGYTKPENAIAKHIMDDDKGVTKTVTPGGTQNVTIINESGLYSLILSSKLPSAKEFKRWITSEILPTIRKTGGYNAVNKSDKSLEVKEMNAKVRLSNQFLKLANVDTLSSEYKNILVAKAAEVLTGMEIIPLPKSAQKMYTASEIGAMFGVSAQKIGRISNEYNLKTAEYGEWYHDKSRYSSKEVDSFRYNDKAVEKFKALFS